MAGSGALRELLVFLGMDVDDKPLQKADKQVEKTAESIKHLGEMVVEAFAVHEVFEFLKGQVEMGAQLAHTSAMLGVGVEELQEFDYAAASVGVATDEANSALRFLNRTMGEASQGNAEAAQAFARLHVQLKNTDGSARSTVDVLADVADGFTKLPSAAEQTATAMKIFGRSGSTLIPLLKQGSKGVAALTKEFVELGGGMSEDFVENAEKAEHESLKLKTAWTGLSTTVTNTLLPYVSEFVGWIISGVKWFREMTEKTDIVNHALWALAAVSAVLAGIWVVMNIELFLVIAALALLFIAVDDFVAFINGNDSVIGDWLDDSFGPNTSGQVRGFFLDMKKQFGEIIDKVSNELLPAISSLWNALQSDEGQKSLHDFHDTISDVSIVMHDISDTLKAIIGDITWVVNKTSEIRNAIKPEEANNKGAMSGGQRAKNEGLNILDAATSGAWQGLKEIGKNVLTGGMWGTYDALSNIASVPTGPANNGWGVNGDQNNHHEVTVNNYNNGGDPKEISKATQDGVRDALADKTAAAWNANGGGAAP